MSIQALNEIRELERKVAELEAAVAELQRLILAQVRQSTPKGKAA